MTAFTQFSTATLSKGIDPKAICLDSSGRYELPAGVTLASGMPESLPSVSPTFRPTCPKPVKSICTITRQCK